MYILTTTSSFSINEFPDGLNVIHNPYKRKLTGDEIKDLIIKYQPVGIIAGVEPLTREVMMAAENLKVISRCGIGIDSVDMKAAGELGIKVTITPEAPMISVAELTIGLILSIIRKITVLDAGIRKGGWKGPKGNLLWGKTVGIIGCGRIGTYVSRLLKAFGCDVIGYDPYIKEHEICRMVGFEELLEKSDIISLHIPYTDENKNIIGAAQLKQMKPTCLLINAARGGLIDEDALYEALKNGEIAGAALDCFAEEPYSGPLTKLENTVLIPHMGSSATEARIMMEKQALDNLIKGLEEFGII
ncbi:MAG TPA: phosphoglycerate dehydrogenase [Clostridiaceae bacterium]|nr:phosphoglycerate dehydrogenase [Clostridiaceae bacterium]